MNLRLYLRKKFKKKKKVHFISDKESLRKLDLELNKGKLLAIDTEFDWRTTYFPKLSLIQISSLQQLFLIDCLKVNPKKVLKKYLEDESFLKIFHSVRSDTTVLSKCLFCKTKNVFDIQIADRILSNEEIKSYGKIVKKFFPIELEKTETNSNWLKRPLTENQIKYALDDVDFLLEIYSLQKKKLIKKGLLNQAVTASSREADLGNESLKKLRLKKKSAKLSKRDKDIFIWREEIAEAENIPPTFIFKEKFLHKLSKIRPDDTQAKTKLMKIFGDSELTSKFISNFL
tara:strand:- start:1052 stop:1912 length:861 start_codon:yes stop_codon:yes gene_type:complete